MVALDQDAARPSARSTPNDAAGFAKFYRAAWRWHFYAGLYVIPFFIMLATTGMFMMWIAFIDGRDGERTRVVPQDTPIAMSLQAKAVLAEYPQGTLEAYTAPRGPDLAALFRVNTSDGAMMVVLDPYTGQVIKSFARRSGLYDTMDNIHGTILLGVTGDRMIEVAASLGLILIATGLFMWWPRSTATSSAMKPNLAARGRGLWKNLHSVVGFWSAAMLIVFLISGLSWAGVWGEKIVQAWSSFPAEKWGAPLSDVPHGSMNNGPKEVPWVLEQTPMPASGSLAGREGLKKGVPVTLDSIDALARAIGFDVRYQLSFPKGDTGVWTMSRDSMNTDSANPMSDRTVHVDRYSGKILADVKYADYSLMGKAMAVGIGFHMGTVGLPFLLLNTVFCLSIVFLCISGGVMWFMRRPAGQKGLVPPPAPRDMPVWKGAVFLALVLCMAFPMAGAAVILALAFDLLIMSRGRKTV